LEVNLASTRNTNSNSSSYTNFLLPRHTIRTRLTNTWLFNCRCSRCSDPTEFNLFYSSRKCKCGDYLCVIDNEDGEANCRVCSSAVNLTTLQEEEMSSMKELSLTEEPEELLALLEDLNNRSEMHPTHHLLIRLYMRLLESAARGCQIVIGKALEHSQTLMMVLRKLDGDEGQLVRKYGKMEKMVMKLDLLKKQNSGEICGEMAEKILAELIED